MCTSLIVLLYTVRYLPPQTIFSFPADCNVDRVVRNEAVILFQETDIQEVKEINQKKSGMKNQMDMESSIGSYHLKQCNILRVPEFLIFKTG